MTPERQRIAIAEICGITGFHGVGLGRYYGYLSNGHAVEVPDYLVDLNAMREVLTTLGERERKVFECILAAIVGGFEIEDFTDPSSYIGWFEAPAGTVFTLLISSASQQAEAFLRAKGRWEDSLTPSPP